MEPIVTIGSVVAVKRKEVCPSRKSSIFYHVAVLCPKTETVIY
jgi:hypothetical protein